MKVKKFICKRCLAPKVTKIKTSYVVCDYCASLMDVDLTTGHKEYYADPEKVAEYEETKYELESLSENAFEQGDREAYTYYRNAFWTMYLNTYPEYILPTVNTPKLLEEWCTLCANIDTYHRFQPGADDAIASQQQVNNNIEFYTVDGANYADWESFMRATRMYYDSLYSNLKEMREVPEFNMLNSVFPLDIAIKKEMSMYAQMWVPYLEEKYHESFLDFVGLKTEYIDIPPVEIREKPCKTCGMLIQVPDGAIVSKCDSCNKDNTWTKITCSGCGGENELPEHWHETITCVYCTTETRVINKLYG